MEPFDEDAAEVDVCVRCGGLWFEAGELAKAIRAYDVDAAPRRTIAESVTGNLVSTPHTCHRCALSLHAYALSEANPIHVEICPGCSGVWLPHGELERAQAGHHLPDSVVAIDAARSWAHWFFQFLAGLPVEFNIAPRRVPVVTYGLIALTGILFALQMLSADGLREYSLFAGAIGETLWFESLLTSQFLHAGVIHLLGNMYFLWILGDNVEDVFGRVYFLVFYLMAGVVAGVAFSLLTDTPDLPVLGASGAISGVIAAYAVLFHRARLTFMLFVWQWKMAAPLYVGLWFVFNLAGWWVGSLGVAWEAHLGGFFFGLLVSGAAYRSLLRGRPLLRLMNRQATFL